MERYKPKANGHTNGKANGRSPDAPVRGRPTSFRPEYVEQAKKLSALGATDLEMANFFEVSLSTYYLWKHAHPTFSDALKLGKGAADERVEKSLYQRAVGYSHPAEKIFNNNGRIIRAGYTEHYPPDTGACAFWLKNRRKDDWKDRVVSEHTGPDGGPIEVSSVADEIRKRLDELVVPTTVVVH